MKEINRQLEKYLWEAIGIQTVLRSWEESLQLPQYLRERYRFLKMDVQGIECVMMVDTARGEQTPSIIGKHMDQVRYRQNAEVVYVREAVTSYNRKRLIEQKVPFIVPGNQMYLPMLGIDLREHLKRLREKKPVFSPSTQALILHVLWQKKAVTLTPAETARRLGYSAMTMTRAFDELEMAGIGEHSVLGKERQLRFAETGKILWDKALPYLNDPVRRRFYVMLFKPLENSLHAGRTALSQYTLLAEPQIPVFAYSAEAWKERARQTKDFILAVPEQEAVEIEIWKYSPALLAHEGIVDRLSLYLSMRTSAEERTQLALDELLGGMEW